MNGEDYGENEDCGENGENYGKEIEKNGNTGLEPFDVTLVTVEDLDSSDVTLVNSNATLVTVENLEYSNVTLGSEGKNIMGVNLNNIAMNRM